MGLLVLGLKKSMGDLGPARGWPNCGAGHRSSQVVWALGVSPTAWAGCLLCGPAKTKPNKHDNLLAWAETRNRGYSPVSGNMPNMLLACGFGLGGPGLSVPCDKEPKFEAWLCLRGSNRTRGLRRWLHDAIPRLVPQ